MEIFGKKPEDKKEGGEKSPSSLEPVKPKQVETPKEELTWDMNNPKHVLAKKQHKALNGRLETEIPLNDEYWKIRAEIQQELHKLENEEKK